MRPLKGELLLEAWAKGSAESGPDRALALLSVALGGAQREELADLALADCNRELLHLRRLTFGDTLRGVVACSSCATRLEFEVPVESLIERLDGLRPSGDASWSVGGIRFSMRPVRPRDLAGIASARDPRRRLLAACASAEGSEAASAVAICVERAVEEFNRLNEGAEARFTLPCPACGTSDQVDFDIGQFLWSEVRHAALSMLRDVHELASAYGWSERAILDMPAARRACYLEMVRA